MEKKSSTLAELHERRGQEIIADIKRKIDTTRYNMEISKEIIADTPSEAQRKKLLEKNTKRIHAIGSMQKEIRDIEQTINERGREVST